MNLPKILYTKIVPPRLSARLLPRPRVEQALAEALSSRVTILRAGAGYGKSTALAALTEWQTPLIWYQVTEDDNDPLIFLLHLCHATQRALLELNGLPVPFLEAWEGARGPLPAAGVVDQYLNALCQGLEHPTLLVLDDVHLVASSEIAHLIDRLVSLAPPDLHLILSGRPPLNLPGMSRWRFQGELLVLDQTLLAFRSQEIGGLFANCYGYDLTTEEAEALYAITEGWAIALHLVWQSLRSGASSSLEEALARQVESPEGWFEVLAAEVFAGQADDVKDFLLRSATLREMTPEACDALLETTSSRPGTQRSQQSSAAMLAYLRRQELFVVEQSSGVEGQRGSGSTEHRLGGYPGEANAFESAGLRLRYHHIFHNFLRRQAAPTQRTAWHLQAAAFYQTQSLPDEAIYHLLQAHDLAGAAALLDDYGGQLLAMGRLERLAAYLEALPPEILQDHPALLFYLGDLARVHSRFQEALGWYQQAEALWREQGQREGIARALRGQARIYLDTVNPSRAEELLQKVLRLSDGIDDRDSRARVYELLSENRLNAGQAEEAERLREQAEALRSEGPSDAQLLFRVLLRTGRLNEARQRLEARAEVERGEPVQTPRAHRETLLLLSLIYAFQGQAQAAYVTAQEGTRRGIELNSPFVTAVGHMRQGHALTLPHRDWPGTFFTGISQDERYAQARQQFEKAIELSRKLATPRLRVEACWGLCRVFGYQGELAQALQSAEEGIEIATLAGDEWIASLVRLAMGASLVLAARYTQAEEWLSRAALGFQECSDPFALCATRLWLCLGWWRQSSQGLNEDPRLLQVLPETLATCHSHRYDYLFTQPSLLGPPDERALVPLLILARQHNWEADYTDKLLHTLELSEIDFHPGYQLRIATMGSFQAWHGDQPISPGGWRREKARQLFQVLLTYRQAPLDREQIIEYLWPGLEPSTAQRNFKVALNALYHVLEPGRTAGSESAYVVREGSTYALRHTADMAIDSQVFVMTIAQAEAWLSSSENSRAFEDSSHKLIPEERARLGLQELERALRLYQGEYLPDARYETWAAAEREHLEVLFLRSADRLTELYLQHSRFEDAIDLCQRILSYDNCWERAYRHLMVAFDRLGDHGQVARTYQRCLRTLREELAVEPAAETEALFQRLAGKA